jgi:hypothetical protein
MESRKSFLLRINPGLWSDLEAWAQEDMRSVNAQIEFLLKQAIQRRKGKNDEKLTAKNQEKKRTE